MKCKEVVTFVDASRKACGTVSYLQSEYEEGSVTTRLIASKSKVVPPTSITVPRLEFIGAIVGLRLTQSVSRALEVLQLKAAAFYSDSRAVFGGSKDEGEISSPLLHWRNTNVHRSSSMAACSH